MFSLIQKVRENVKVITRVFDPQMFIQSLDGSEG